METRKISLKSTANMDKPLNKEMVDLAFISSNNIKDIETGIEKALKTNTKILLSVCLGLAKIDEEALYKSYGDKSFHSYLKNQTMLPYSTGLEYAYIGKNFIKMKNELEQIGFDNNQGLSKLRYIPKNYDSFNIEDKKAILNSLVKDSNRGFKLFVASKNKKPTNARADKKEDKFTLKDINDMVFNNMVEKLSFIKDPSQKEKALNIIAVQMENFTKKIKELAKKGNLTL